METNFGGIRRGRMAYAGGFFSKLTASAMDDFVVMAQPSRFASNLILFTEGQPGKGIFVVHRGEVCLSINSCDGKRLSLRIAREDEIVGLSSTVSGLPYDMTAETLCPSWIAVIGRNEFLRFLARHPEAYPAVTEELARFMTNAYSQLRTIGLSSSVPEKLARLLLEWCDAAQVPQSDGGMRLSLTHQEIGSFIGASRETISRTLSLFRNHHLIEMSGSIMTIPDRDALADYAQGPVLISNAPNSPPTIGRLE